jgi:hypothetical protein
VSGPFIRPDADRVGILKIPRVKLAIGAPGVDDGNISSTNPLPVTFTAAPGGTTAIAGAGSDYAPQYAPPPSTDNIPAQVDPAGQLMTRGLVLTDEGGYRLNCANASLSVSIGTCTFTNGSTTVTGTGFSAVDVHYGNYVYLDADGITAMAQIDYITDTEITLTSAYTGAGGTGAASRQIVKSVVGTGGTITVSNGQATIAAGTTATSVFELERDMDYLPLVKEGKFSISQRIANQDIYFGFYDESGTPAKWYFWFHFTGVTATTVNCVCAWNPTTTPSGGEIVTQAVTLPASVTTAASNTYRVELLKDRVMFYINEVQVYTERRVVPHPHALMASTLRVANGTTPATNTNVVIDYDACNNFDVVSTENPSKSMEITNPNVPSMELLAYSVAGVIVINTDLGIFDASQYRAFAIQCVAMGTTGVVTVAQSLDGGTTWASTGIWAVGGGAIATTFSAAGFWITEGFGGLIRLRLTTATTAGTTTIRVRGLMQVPFFLTNNTTVSGSVTATGVVGPAAHDAAVSGNPLRQAGRALSSNYTTVATGDTADFITTLQGVQVIRPWQIPELEFGSGDSITNSTTAVQIRVAAAALQNYITSFQIATDTLGAAGDLQIRSTPVVSTTATIASNTLVMSATYGWKVGDKVYVTASTVTGLSAGSYYYLLTVSAANLTFSATRGGGTLVISGTGVNATLSKVLYKTRLQTTSLPLTSIQLRDPVAGGINLAIEACTPTALTSGEVTLNWQGFVAP